MKAPPRLLDDPAIAPGLREDLQRASENAPVAYDAAAGLASLHAVIGGAPAPFAPGAEQAGAAHAGAHAGAAATGAASAGVGVGVGMSAAKLALIALGTSVAIATGVATWPSAHTAEHQTRPAARANAKARAIPAQPTAPAPAADRPTPAIAPTPAAVPAPAIAPDPTRAASPSEAIRRTETDGDGALRGEVAQLRAIKASLEHNPAQAYRLALAGQRKWKNGVLAQEREGLIVLALWSLERRGEAREQARTFLERYPNSPLRERLQPILSGAVP